MASHRFAFLIGSFEYAQEPALHQLNGPPNDIAALDEALKDSAIGDFKTQTSMNESKQAVHERLDEFLMERHFDDVVLVYFSGHGIKTIDGELYFAMANTRMNRLSTALKARDVHDLLRNSPARQKLLLLDCCYSGAFARGVVMKAGNEAGTADCFENGRGHAVLTASDAVQYAFEDGHLKAATSPKPSSVFTRVLVEGLVSGLADRDRDGVVTFDELYEYVYDEVRRANPAQTPRKWALDQQGRMIIAKVARALIAAPSDLAKIPNLTINADYLTKVLNGIDAAVLLISPGGDITRANEAAVQLFGYSEAEIAGKSFLALLDPNERESFQVNAPEGEARESIITTRSGQTIPVSISGHVLAADNPQLQGTILVIRNISERKRAERRIRYLARYDALTKIPNRMQFQHVLQQAMARARRHERSIVMLYLDMDRFKEINDTFGHAAGDRTLEVLSERLTRILPREAVVGRLAGDEFGLFIEGFAEAEDERTQSASLARMLLVEVCKAFYIDQQEVFLTASVGIAFYPKDAENMIDLIRNADAAMYHSKQNGGNSFAFYSPDMNAAAVERLMIKSKLRRALERDELIMFYQPKIDLRDGRIVGAEALLRWRLPGHGDIPPSQFIPLAEETNLILGVGEWVLNRVCADYRGWIEKISNPGRVSINISLKQLRQASFITRCRSVFRRHEVAPTCFELEITETTLMQDPKRTIKLLDELHAMGLHLSIDAFGTGYSSLSALQQFPIGTLKIDQSFVRDVAINSDDAAIVRTIIDMGRTLDIEVVAVGVETEEQSEFLRSRGCHYAQGLLFADAMSAADFLVLLQAKPTDTESR